MIGAKIRRLRLSRSLTLDEVGAAIGASKQTVYKYETGVISHIPSDKIEALIPPMLRICMPSGLWGTQWRLGSRTVMSFW